MTQDSILRFAGNFSGTKKCGQKSVPVRGFPKILWHGTYLNAIYKSAIFRDLSFFHRFALIKKGHDIFFSSLETATQSIFWGRKRPCEMMIFGPGPIGGLNSRSWVAGKVSNALEMRGASYDARNTRSGLLAYIHIPRVWFVGHMAHGSRFPKLWPPHLPQILPEVFQSSRIPHPGCPGLISSKSNASLSFDSISTAWDSTFWDWDWLLG